MCVECMYIMALILLQWLEKKFLGYLNEWEKSVEGRVEIEKERNKMLLSRETIEGLRMSGV